MDVTVNTHIHTPYSFSGFDSVTQAVECAAAENVRVLGISDFNTVEGFSSFEEACRTSGVYPLYNIEFIALSEDDRDAGKRWNDPQNPGLIYFCGKGLDHPVRFSDDSRNRLAALWKGSQDLMWKTIEKLNTCLKDAGIPISLDYTGIRSTYARDTVRERHVARALCDSLLQMFPDPDRLRTQLAVLWNGSAGSVDVTDAVVLQNELRSRLLKAGKPAFVETSPSAFLSLAEVMKIILDGGGIPCYPVLADDSRELNEQECDVNALSRRLSSLGIHAVEFIPARNSFDLLKKYAGHFHRKGFCVTFGTEHNTPARPSLVPRARGETTFDSELEKIGYEGACIIAAHQDHRRKGQTGYVDSWGGPAAPGESRARLVEEGDSIIRTYLNVI